MFLHKVTIHMSDTDMTGVLYFTQQIRLALETFEHLLKFEGVHLEHFLRNEPFLMPIVHTESDFFKPIRVCDELEIALKVEAIGTSSFTIKTTFYKLPDRISMGESKIVHVVIDKATEKSCSIPEKMLNILYQYKES